MFPCLTLTLHKTIQVMQIHTKWKMKFNSINSGNRCTVYDVRLINSHSLTDSLFHIVMDHIGHQSCPAGLMAGSYSTTIISVKILMEKNQVFIKIVSEKIFI